MNSKQVFFISLKEIYNFGDDVQLPENTLVGLNFERIVRLVCNLNQCQKKNFKGVYAVCGPVNAFDDMGEMSFLKKTIKAKVVEVINFKVDEARKIILGQQKTGVAQKVFADQIQKVC